jgi:hypothetical protein
MTSNDTLRIDIGRYIVENDLAPRKSGLEKVGEYRSFVELSAKTHTYAQVLALDKLLRNDPNTAKAYTGLTDRTFYFAFNTRFELYEFQTNVKQMLQKRFVVTKPN